MVDELYLIYTFSRQRPNMATSVFNISKLVMDMYPLKMRNYAENTKVIFIKTTEKHQS